MAVVKFRLMVSSQLSASQLIRLTFRTSYTRIMSGTLLFKEFPLVEEIPPYKYADEFSSPFTYWNLKITSSRNTPQSGFGGIEVACWHLVPKFAGSHPAEAVGFLGRKKSSARLSSEGK
jgi:hypothetical protein